MRISLTSLLLVWIMSCSAQIEKGSIAAGGNIGLSSQKDPNQSIFKFSLAPDVLFFAAKNFALGPKVGYALSTRKPKATTTTDLTQDFFIGPNLRYYFKLSDNVYAFMGASVFYATGKYKQLQSTSNLSQVYYGVSWEAGPGLSIFPAKNISVEIAPQYRGSYITDAIKNSTGTIGTPTSTTTHGFFLEIGFRYFFRKTAKV